MSGDIQTTNNDLLWRYGSLCLTIGCYDPVSLSTLVGRSPSEQLGRRILQWRIAAECALKHVGCQDLVERNLALVSDVRTGLKLPTKK